MGDQKRAERLQVMLTEDELRALDDWRFAARMPSRASAIRELLKRGLAAEGFSTALAGSRSGEFGVVEQTPEEDPSRTGSGGADKDEAPSGAEPV